MKALKTKSDIINSGTVVTEISFENQQPFSSAHKLQMYSEKLYDHVKARVEYGSLACFHDQLPGTIQCCEIVGKEGLLDCEGYNLVRLDW